MNIEELAKKVAEYANTCLSLRDGVEENVFKAELNALVFKMALDALECAIYEEREACAKTCEDRIRGSLPLTYSSSKFDCEAMACAMAIRARCNK